jgi:hypothetical protein
MTAVHNNSDIDTIAANPSKFFKAPADVLVAPKLSRNDKIKILQQWEVDARLLAVAEEENMGAGESSHLGAIVSALIALEDENKMPGADKTPPPTKLGG